MKARTEPDSDPVCDNSAFEELDSSALLASDKEKNDRSKFGHPRKQINGFSNNGNETHIGNESLIFDLPEQTKLHPLHFDTREVLDETPPILKSLSSGSRGPTTFIYYSSSKPSRSSENDDPFKTFVISSGEETDLATSRKNSCNQTSVLNGFGNGTNRGYSIDGNEYLSYVIEKANGSKSEPEEMSDKTKICKEGEVNDDDGEVRLDRSEDELDGAVADEFRSFKSESYYQNRFSNSKKINSPTESQICDRKVQSNASPSDSEESGVLSFDRTIADKKEHAFSKLQEELEKAHQELKLKDEEVTRLTRIREDVERELEELTASLFQEAHKMVGKAKERQAAAEKSLAESQMKVDVLTAEVVALKTLVLTSTPSRPNPHLHPQIGKEENGGGVNLFNKKHRRSPSHFNLKYGRENSPPDSPVQDKSSVSNNAVPNASENRDISEVDPTIHKEFFNWSSNCKLDKTDPFIDRIYREDINLCLDFSNRELAEEVQKAIETRNIFIEAVTDKSKTIFPRKCALLEVTRQCHYRMKLGDQDTWYNISQMCRNRIIAVCDFINYLRYIELGLVKSSAHEMYWEIMRLRKEMVLARLGLSSPSS